MSYLNELFTVFDALVDTYQIYKVGWRWSLCRSRTLQASSDPCLLAMVHGNTQRGQLTESAGVFLFPPDISQ